MSDEPVGRSAVEGIKEAGRYLRGPLDVEFAEAAGVEAAYHELRSTKGHDAFLVEWDQLAEILREALDAGR